MRAIGSVPARSESNGQTLSLLFLPLSTEDRGRVLYHCWLLRRATVDAEDVEYTSSQTMRIYSALGGFRVSGFAVPGSGFGLTGSRLGVKGLQSSWGFLP